MTRRCRLGLAACALAVVSAPACGAGGTHHPAARVESAGSHPAASSASTSTTGAHRVEKSRAPRVLDHGENAVAVARSLLGYRRWLERHPDPALVDRTYAWGSNVARDLTARITTLRRTGRRVVEVDAAPLDFAIVSHLADVVAFHVTEHLAHRELIDAGGTVLRRVGPETEYYDVLIERDRSDSPWRVLNAARTPSSFRLW